MKKSKKLLSTAVLLVAGLSQFSAYAVDCSNDAPNWTGILYCTTGKLWVKSYESFYVHASSYGVKADGSLVARGGYLKILKARDYKSDSQIYYKTFTGAFTAATPTLANAGDANYYLATGETEFYSQPDGTVKLTVAGTLLKF